ncbi:hypothetical protein NBRC116594_14720 [Shimia sp. NS0008-38b]
MDFSDIGFTTFADAACVRLRGTPNAAAQYMSPNRSLMCVYFARSKAALKRIMLHFSRWEIMG